MVEIIIKGQRYYFYDDALNTANQKAVYFLQKQESDPLESKGE